MQHAGYIATGQPLTERYAELGMAGWDAGPDQLLYHYTRAETALEAILPGATLRLNPFAVMRDPLEYQDIPLMLRYNDASASDRLPLREAQQVIRDVRAQMRVLSLTMDATGYEDERLRAFGRGYARPRMWENYAEAHHGVCLAFSASCLTGPFCDTVGHHGAVSVGPVKYTEGGFVVSKGRIIDANGLTEVNAPERLTKHVREFHDDFWFLKLLDWETEYEYRIVLFSPAGSGPIDVAFGACLRAIILGERVDDSLVPRAREHGATFGVPVVRLCWDSGRPSVRSIS